MHTQKKQQAPISNIVLPDGRRSQESSLQERLKLQVISLQLSWAVSDTLCFTFIKIHNSLGGLITIAAFSSIGTPANGV